MALRNLKDVITAPAMVKVKKVFEPELDGFGKNRRNAIVELNNEDLYASFKERDFQKAVPGNQLFANPKQYKDKPYIEWLNGPNQTFAPQDLPFKTDLPDTTRIDRDDRITKSQAVNLASEKIARYLPLPPAEDYEKVLLAEAEKIYISMKNWL